LVFTGHDEVEVGFLFTEADEGFTGESDEAEGFARRFKAPAGKAEDAIVGEVAEVVDKGVGGVEIILSEGEGAGGGGSPGVDEGGLDDLIFLVAAADEAAAVFDDDFDFRAEVEAAAFLGELLHHDGVGDDGIDFDGRDVFAAGGDGAGDVVASAGSDDEGFGAIFEAVRERGAFAEEL
jgi:hypothetical protein